MNLSLRELETCLMGGPETPEQQDRPIALVRTDSRAVGEGDVFFCLTGERFDGHEFARQAAGQGAAAIVSGRPLPEVMGPRVIVVRDTLKALGRLARHMRDKARARVVAVTGTAGKTTVKELLATVAATRLDTAKSFKNFNNQVGLPHSIFAASGLEDVWVLELGISLPHDMDELGVIAAPDMAVIHNIGPAHLQGLGSMQGVARAKASILKHLKPGGIGIVSADYPLLLSEAKAILPGLVEFSARDEDCAFFCRFAGADAEGRGRFELKTAAGRLDLLLPVCGTHFAENLAAVAAAAHHLDLPLEAVAEGAARFSMPDQRFCCLRGQGFTLIDDSYNANPLSMARAAETARVMAGDRPLVLVLGDMRELGGDAAGAHENLGRGLKALAPLFFFYEGSHAADVAAGYGVNGSGRGVTEVAGPEQLLSEFRALGLSEGVVLVKGSRSCRMERYVQALAAELGCRAAGGRQA